MLYYGLQEIELKLIEQQSTVHINLAMIVQKIFYEHELKK
jgi:hypothetical protein